MLPVFIPGAPPPAGHYSPAVVHGGLVFVSGQLPTVPGQAEHVVGSIEEQTERCLRNVERVLQAAGSSLNQVLQMTVYISDGDLWGRVNATYAQIMGTHKPARAVVPVKDLHYGYQIEIQAIAALP
ncbi:MAG TPA: RidA family protein [Gemmatimonadaceae bacterium]|nr:RidA family protein [Gemmatimonadaceae bacterium]